MNLRTNLFILLLSMIPLFAQSQTRIIAHRGYWKTEGSAQNSRAALLKADSIHCYGAEFDVRLSKDGQLIVNHDPTYKMVSIEHNKSKKLQKLKLANGESLPTLKEYFKIAQPTHVRLILELKELSSRKQETEAVKKIIQLVRKMNLENRMEYISFSSHAVKEFIRLAPAGTPVYYLKGDLPPQALKEMGCAGADYSQRIFKQHPEWIDECHQLGLKVNVWTVNKKEDMKRLIRQKVDFITTNEPIRLQQLLQIMQPEGRL